MRRAATSAFALTLPAKPRPVLVEMPLPHVARPGVFFEKIGKHRRAVYEQFSGELILAEECSCRVDWVNDVRCSLHMQITRSSACPIDQHRVRAR